MACACAAGRLCDPQLASVRGSRPNGHRTGSTVLLYTAAVLAASQMHAIWPAGVSGVTECTEAITYTTRFTAAQVAGSGAHGTCRWASPTCRGLHAARSHIQMRPMVHHSVHALSLPGGTHSSAAQGWPLRTDADASTQSCILRLMQASPPLTDSQDADEAGGVPSWPSLRMLATSGSTMSRGPTMQHTALMCRTLCVYVCACH